MTAIIGMHGFPGVILCADSEETISGYSKRQVDKIAQWTHEPFRFSIGAAGAGHYADMVANNVSDSLFKLSECSLASIQDAISEPLLEFHEKHIWPRVNQDSATDAAIQLIVVVQPLPGGGPHIFHTCETAVKYLNDRSYVSIGVGSHLADYILETIYVPAGGDEHLIATAIYVMREVSRHIATVGSVPNLYFFKNDGTVRFLEDIERKEIEDVIEEWDFFVRRIFEFATDVGDTSRDSFTYQRLTELLSDLKSKFEGVKERQIERDQRLREWMNKRGIV